MELPTAVPAPAAEIAHVPGPSGGPSTTGAPTSAVQGLDIWIENFRKYEATLQEVTKASAEPKFKAELSTIEQWFKVLSEPERTASVYTLLLHSDQDQIRFYISVLQQMIRPDVIKPEVKVEDVVSLDPPKPKQGGRNMRPPSLNIPLLGSPTTPTATPITATEPVTFPPSATERTPEDLLSGLRMKGQMTNANGKDTDSATVQGITGLPGLGMMSPYHLNMIANAGLSSEAQLLAVQLVMSGVVQPVGAPQSQRQSQKKPPHLGDAKNWRAPTSAKYPGSALRTGGLRAATLKNAGLKSAGLPSASLLSAGLMSSGLDSGASMGSPREEDFDPEMLKDIPAWLRGLRLHKYTSCFDGLTWQEMVVLEDSALEAKGIVALGARRRLLRTFEHVRKRMDIDSPNATPTTSGLPAAAPDSDALAVPHSAAPTSKLSITSPVFVPSFERVPQSAAPTVSLTAPATD